MDKDVELGERKIDSPADSSDTAEGNDLCLQEVEPVDICVRSLTVNIDVSPSNFTAFKNPFNGKRRNQEKEYKSILHDISADIPHGSLTAVIGASGSGKTSMLNVLSRRLKSANLQIEGTILYNEDAAMSTVRSAYVMQQDILIPTLTVRETLTYAAELRLPPPTTRAERSRVVEAVILELGLKECAKTRIGNNVHKGCSGGEKRRTSLGVQLLANPSVLFLDEVTTGLDATTAFQLIRTLKSLAEKGRTVVVVSKDFLQDFH